MNRKCKEYLLEERDILKVTIEGSEKKLERNKEKLEVVEHMLQEQFGWAESEETTQTDYL